MPILDHKRLLLVKAEVTPGTDSTPTAAANAIQCENLRWRNQFTSQETAEYTASLDTGDPIPGATIAEISVDVWLNGSGTPETAPEWGPLLRACGWSQTLTATAVPASAEACGSGASQTAVTLGASAGTTDDQYNGMPIVLTNTGAGTSFIHDYVGSGKVASLVDDMGAVLSTGTSYQIPKNALYVPSSSSILSDTMWAYKDGILQKGVGVRGNMDLSMAPREAGKFTFTFMAMWTPESDTSIPAASTVVYQNQVKPIWMGTTNRARLNRVALGLSRFTLNNGATLNRPDNPEAAQGYDPAEITRRTMMATVDPLMTLKATYDALTDAQNGTKRVMHMRAGQTAGNRWGITMPAVMVVDPDQSGERNGFAAQNLRLRLTGANQGCYICQY